MNPFSGPVTPARLVLFMIFLALLGSCIAGIDYAEEVLPQEKATVSPSPGLASGFYLGCLDTCSMYYHLCLGNKLHKFEFQSSICAKEREKCNTTCEEPPAPQP